MYTKAFTCSLIDVEIAYINASVYSAMKEGSTRVCACVRARTHTYRVGRTY